MNLDLYLFNKINGQAKKSKTLDFFAIFFAEYAGYLFLVFLLAFGVMVKDWQIFVIPVLAGLFTRFVINEIVYVYYQRKRPVEILPANLLIKKPKHPAFPSGHASFFFAVSFALLLFSFPLAVISFIISLIVSISRIFCGVHWPSDILAGIGAAMVSFLLLYLSIQPVT